MDKISVIIPCYNVEKYLPACLYSVLHQTIQNIEVIAIDDKSTDKTWDILKKYQKKYPKKLRIYQNEANKGVSYCRNLGVSLADGNYIGFVDSDDVIVNRMYEYLYRAIKEHAIEMSFCIFERIFRDEYIKPKEIKSKEPYRIGFQNYKVNPTLIYDQSVAVWNKLYSHDLISQVSFLEGHVHEDVSVCYPLLMKAEKTVFVKNILYFYRITPCSITSHNRSNRDIFDLFDIYQDAMVKGKKLHLTDSQMICMEYKIRRLVLDQIYQEKDEMAQNALERLGRFRMNCQSEQNPIASEEEYEQIKQSYLNRKRELVKETGV